MDKAAPAPPPLIEPPSLVRSRSFQFLTVATVYIVACVMWNHRLGECSGHWAYFTQILMDDEVAWASIGPGEPCVRRQVHVAYAWFALGCALLALAVWCSVYPYTHPEGVLHDPLLPGSIVLCAAAILFQRAREARRAAKGPFMHGRMRMGIEDFVLMRAWND